MGASVERLIGLCKQSQVAGLDKAHGPFRSWEKDGKK
jgi:hypothetical protein